MKILMALAGLDIGGAETHVVELSKEMKRRGHDVVMISGGGVYQKEVEQFGIKHYLVPVNVRNYKNIIAAKRIIKKIIKAEKPDIVHAHARIPAFVIGVVHREMHRSFVYVTTAHWTFDTSFLVRTLTCWGEKTLAVSEDIKKYLLKYYNVDEKNIFVSINGISSEKFNKNVSGEKIIDEFGLNPNAKRIVYVSRLNPLVCAPAFKITEKIGEIDKAVPGVEFIIVGDGDARADLQAKADEANKKLGRRAVILTGGRTDINELHAASNVSVGVSRAILEPMAMEKRCVIAGQEGYIGILTEEKLPEAIGCNFTCRGCAPLEADRLAKDIITLLLADEAEGRKLTDYCKYVVDTYYSIKTMADDNLNMYKSAMRSHAPNTVMLGYYGYGNRGDDALLYAILSDLSECSDVFSPIVLSYDPKATARDYGVKSINRFNIIKVRRAMKKGKIFIAGGGSLIQDVTSTKSLLYYLYCIRLAKKLGLKVMLYANGIGPVNGAGNRRKVSKVLNLADVITLRDSASAKLLKELGVNKPDISVTGDPAFSLEADDPEACNREAAKRCLKEAGVNGKFICVSVRSLGKRGKGFDDGFAQMLDYIAKKYDCVPLFISMQYERDRAATLRILGKMESRGVFIDKKLSVSEIMGIISQAYSVIAVRLHMLIFGVVCGVPVLGVNYDPKVKGVLDAAGLGNCLDTADISDGGYTSAVDGFMENLAPLAQKTADVAREFKVKAKENAAKALELMEE